VVIWALLTRVKFVVGQRMIPDPENLRNLIWKQ